MIQNVTDLQNKNVQGQMQKTLLRFIYWWKYINRMPKKEIIVDDTSEQILPFTGSNLDLKTVYNGIPT